MSVKLATSVAVVYDLFTRLATSLSQSGARSLLVVETALASIVAVLGEVVPCTYTVSDSYFVRLEGAG